ncbi:MAG: hypothetical protein WCI57_02810 [Candidatus Berkelbacteria bacterium]
MTKIKMRTDLTVSILHVSLVSTLPKEEITMHDLVTELIERRTSIEIEAIEMTITMIEQKIEMTVAVHLPNTCKFPGEIYQRTYFASFTYKNEVDKHNLPYVQYELVIQDPPLLEKYGRCEKYGFTQPNRIIQKAWEVNQKRAKEFALRTLKLAGINAYIYAHEWPSTLNLEKRWVSIYYRE